MTERLSKLRGVVQQILICCVVSDEEEKLLILSIGSEPGVLDASYKY